MGRQRRDIIELFWSNVNKSDGCWTWNRKPIRGYGRMCISGKAPMQAHRFSWELHFGTIPDRLWVLHRCDNRICVRPDHLFLGTPQDNTDDMWAKGRGSIGSRANKSDLTEETVASIRAEYIPRGPGSPPKSKGQGPQEGSIKWLANKYAVSASLISQIINRSIWKHVT